MRYLEEKSAYDKQILKFEELEHDLLSSLHYEHACEHSVLLWTYFFQPNSQIKNVNLVAVLL